MREIKMLRRLALCAARNTNTEMLAGSVLSSFMNAPVRCGRVEEKRAATPSAFSKRNGDCVVDLQQR
jgi:hypothetical protein